MQLTSGDAEQQGRRKRTRREVFLSEMEQVVPWKGLLALILPNGVRLAYQRIQARHRLMADAERPRQPAAPRSAGRTHAAASLPGNGESGDVDPKLAPTTATAIGRAA